jgi:hypothetical protein
MTQDHAVGQIVGTDLDPGNINEPVIIEPPSLLVDNRLEVWIGVSGGEYWGGCQIWLSLDGDTYALANTARGSRTGLLDKNFASGSDPDVSHICSVDLSECRGSLIGATEDAADMKTTLCWVDGELISYSTAELASQYHYRLKDYIRRGLYGTTPARHNRYSQFLRIDGTQTIIPYTTEWIGRTVYAKFLSFNIFGRMLQRLDQVPAYYWTIGESGHYIIDIDNNTIVVDEENFAVVDGDL